MSVLEKLNRGGLRGEPGYPAGWRAGLSDLAPRLVVRSNGAVPEDDPVIPITGKKLGKALIAGTNREMKR